MGRPLVTLAVPSVVLPRVELIRYRPCAVCVRNPEGQALHYRSRGVVDPRRVPLGPSQVGGKIQLFFGDGFLDLQTGLSHWPAEGHLCSPMVDLPEIP